MKLAVRLIQIGMLAMALPAWADDALWNKTVAQMAAAQKLVAGDIDMVMTVVKDGPSTPLHLRSHLSGWDKGKPVYTTVVVDAAPGTSPDKAKGGSKMIEAMAQMSGALLEPDTKVTRAEARPLDGKTWAIFEAHEEGVGRKMTATMWVDAETGCPRLVDTDMHAALMLDGRMKTSYALDEQGRCVPRQLDAEVDVKIPFKNMRMKVTQMSSNWVAQPARQ
jgi:hypothetical protein